jgi:hypothetical protein
MTEDDFKQIQVGDKVTHPAVGGVLTVAQIESSYDYSTTPATLWTWSIVTDNGRYLKIGDKRDVQLLQKLS